MDDKKMQDGIAAFNKQINKTGYIFVTLALIALSQQYMFQLLQVFSQMLAIF